MFDNSFNYGTMFYSFYSGLTTILAPCIYPLLPILASAVSAMAAQCKTKTETIYAFTTYAIGIFSVYFFIAFILATAGISNRNLFQGILMPLMLLLINGYLAFFSEEASIYIPSKLLNVSTENTSGLVTVFLSGAVTCISSLPCTGPSLANALSLIALNNETTKGIILLSLYCAGVTIPYLLLGYFRSFLENIPRSGSWLDYVKLFMSLTMLWSVTVYALDTFHILNSNELDADTSYNSSISKINSALSDQSKIILSFGASWCESCTHLHDEALESPNFLHFLETSKYELIQIDLSNPSSNEEIAKIFKVIALPELIILDTASRFNIEKRVSAFPKNWNGTIDVDSLIKSLQD